MVNMHSNIKCYFYCIVIISHSVTDQSRVGCLYPVGLFYCFLTKVFGPKHCYKISFEYKRGEQCAGVSVHFIVSFSAEKKLTKMSKTRNL